MPPNYRQQQGKALTSNERRGTVVLGATVLVAGLGIGIWALASGGGAKSQKGPCVSVVIASSTGGGMVRQCGADAHSWCATEATGTGPEAREVVAQCRRAGLLAQPAKQ
jgi:hypothetical protein